MAGATNPQVWPAGEQTLERALRGESIDDLDICLRRSDGRDPRWVSVFARPLSLPAGLNGSMLVLRDVTERRLAQERVTETARELERSNRELTEFAAVASHDLRAPLRSVTSFVSLIEEDYGDAFTDEGRTYVARIKAAVSRMTGADRRPADAGPRPRQGRAVRAGPARRRGAGSGRRSDARRSPRAAAPSRSGRCRRSRPIGCRCGSCCRT